MPHTDLAYLERFCKGDRTRMERYIRMYLEASPALFDDLATMAGTRDAEGLAAAAHSLRPQVNYMGAQELFDLLTAIEQCARVQGADACSALVGRLPGLTEKVEQELRSVIGSL